MTFTQEELLALLRTTVDDGPDDARTCDEWAAMAGVCRQTMRFRLRALMAEGKIEHVKVKRARLNGVIAPMDAYRLKEKAPA